jgi:hypothetical protein
MLCRNRSVFAPEFRSDHKVSGHKTQDVHEAVPANFKRTKSQKHGINGRKRDCCYHVPVPPLTRVFGDFMLRASTEP